MRILLLGNGGREHALSWRLNQCESVSEIIVGASSVNPGISDDGIDSIILDICSPEVVLKHAQELEIDLVISGGEPPLVAGIADLLRINNISVFGPNKDGAQLEGSKAWMKEVLVSSGAPTAQHQSFTAGQLDVALQFLVDLEEETKTGTYIIKTDGLAGGKGVTVSNSLDEARDAVKEYLSGQAFGDAGTTCVIEEAMVGPEISIFAICDGENVVFIGDAQDHKRINDNDEGLNTGGMGAYSPVPFVDDNLVKQIMAESIVPTVAELKRRSIDYRGVLYAGLMLTKTGPRLLEYNIRFGDPECQILMMRFKGDIAKVLKACADGDLNSIGFDSELNLTDESSLTVVISAKGYPENPEKGAVITGIEQANEINGVKVFFAGVKNNNGQLIVSGGRVLNVTATGESIEIARDRAYKACELINFKGMHYRTDIASQAV
ncbi:MAG: phosphoribosylamine--glycine ligase [Acidimicrobiia bacterium]